MYFTKRMAFNYPRAMWTDAAGLTNGFMALFGTAKPCWMGGIKDNDSCWGRADANAAYAASDRAKDNLVFIIHACNWKQRKNIKRITIRYQIGLYQFIGVLKNLYTIRYHDRTDNIPVPMVEKPEWHNPRFGWKWTYYEM